MDLGSVEIPREFTAPYSPNANGVLERYNQTLFNAVR